MASELQTSFAIAKQSGNPVFIAYITAGYPEKDDTVEIMLSLQDGGADIIELGVPFSDPIADGPTIQESSFQALANGIDVESCLNYVKEARKRGLYIPVIFMGYYNPFLNFGEAKLIKECKEAGVNGFIVVDLPPDEAFRFRNLCSEYSLSYVPLIAPSTSKARLKHLVSVADTFIYVVSTLGVTGSRTTMNQNLPEMLESIREYTDLPLAVGFGVSTREHFTHVGSVAQGVVIGSKLISILKSTPDKRQRSANVKAFAQQITGKSSVEDNNKSKVKEGVSMTKHTVSEPIVQHVLAPRFGEFGGQYAPESLIDCLDEIERAFKDCLNDESFWDDFKSYYSYIGRPSSLHIAPRLTKDAGGANIWLKREDLNHTGSHKINNALGQVLLALRLGKKRIIAETGAGQHGVATATVCAKFGLDCTIYMGADDVQRQALNVFRIRLLGAKVVPVDSGSKTLKDAINEAMRDWVTNVDSTHYLVGSAIGPHPFPTIVREFQSVIGRETRNYFLNEVGKLPDAVIACVGGGSNAIGMFHPFLQNEQVRLIGVEAGGDGIETGRHSATLSAGRPGVLHGTKTYLIQDANGQIVETHSISAGLDYPGVGPEHAFLKDSSRAEYVNATDKEAMIGFKLLSQKEGIIPALETSHAVFKAFELAKTMNSDQNIVICVSGRGDKDVISVAEALPKFGDEIGWDLRFQGENKYVKKFF